MLRRQPMRIELKPEDKQERKSFTNSSSPKPDREKALEASSRERRPRLHFGPGFAINGEAHGKLGAVLNGRVATHEQENFFFDGGEKELSSRLVVLRVRMYNGDQKAVITLKGKAVLKDGVGTASEREEDVDPVLGRSFITQPEKLLMHDSSIIADIKREWNVQSLVCLGGFQNVRQVFEWEGHTLELDETKYEFGTLYELECETTNPEEVRGKLEDFLKKNDIAYEYSTSTKFARFIKRNLDG